MDSRRSVLSISVIVFVLLLGNLSAGAQDAPADPNCPGAPAPRLIDAGRVIPGDSNNVRDQPARSGALLGAIPGGVEFAVLDGPVCADGLNWWRVSTPDITGWTVEGSGADYWIEPFSPADVATPTTTPELIPNPYRNPTISFGNRLRIGATARVQTMDGAPLPVYAAPNETDPVAELLINTLVTLVTDGGVGWWQVDDGNGLSGWVREGVPALGRASAVRPTLAPVCAYSTDRVLFQAFDPALGSDLYTVGLDATHLCNMTYGLQRDFEVYDWSPDGQWIVFSAVLDGVSSCAYGCAGELYVLNVDGSVLRRLTEEQHTSHVQWSPDGAWIAVQMDGEQPRTRDLRLIAPDRLTERVLYTTQADFGLMRWSPDGKTIAVLEDETATTGRSKYIRLIDVDSGETRTLYTSPYRVDSLSWSPDSAFLLAQTTNQAIRRVLIEIDASTGRVVELLFKDTRSATYSPDGTKIAYWRLDLNAPRWIEVLDRESFDILNLARLPGVNDYGLSWYPSGQYLLVSSGGVLRVDATNGSLRSLFVGSFGSNWYPPLTQPSADWVPLESTPTVPDGGDGG
jgi:Tol biopolymer transport system component